MNSIKHNKEIGRSDRQNIYNIYKTNNDLKDVTLDYNEYKNVMDDIEKFRNIDIKKIKIITINFQKIFNA